METEILQQILEKLTSLEQGQAKLEQGQAKLEQGQAKLEQGQAKLEQGQAETNSRLERVEQRVTKLELVLENETNKNIKLLAEGHMILSKKIDDLKDLNVKVIDLQSDTAVHRAAIKELVRKTAN